MSACAPDDGTAAAGAHANAAATQLLPTTVVTVGDVVCSAGDV